MPFSVTFAEEKGYPRETDSVAGFLGERLLRCAWADRHTLITELTRPDNWQWPYVDTPAYVTAVATVPNGKITQGAAAGLASYPDALIHVKYTSGFVKGGTTLISERLTMGTQALSMDPHYLRWNVGANANLTHIETPHVPMGVLGYHRTYHHQATITPLALSMLRTCNDGAYYCPVLNLTFGDECMRYAGVSAEAATVTTGKILWNVTLSFAAREVSWNKFWSAADAAFYEVLDPGGNAVKYYTPTNYSAL